LPLGNPIAGNKKLPFNFQKMEDIKMENAVLLNEKTNAYV